MNHLPVKFKKGINGFPTIVKYKNGKKIGEYSDERVFKNLDKFVKS
jgi:hypothetical protein